MEIQYAMFCANVKFPNQPQDAVVLTKPISALSLSEFGGFNLPLFVIFLNGEINKRYNLETKVLDFSGTVVATMNHNFSWIKSELSQAEVVMVKFPFSSIGYHTFILSVDGKELHKFRVPINKLV